jgi:hypothetical protein
MGESIFDRGPGLRTEACVATRRSAPRGKQRLEPLLVWRTGATAAPRPLSRFACCIRSSGRGRFERRQPMRERRRTRPAHSKNSCVCVRMIGWKQKSAQRTGANLRAQRNADDEVVDAAKRAAGAKRTRREGLLVANAPVRFSG